MSVWRHRSRRTRILPLALLLAHCALPASAQDRLRSNAPPLLNFSELKPGWNVLRPGGDTLCAKGGEYAFFVRPVARDKLLIWFEGGGACWTAEDCDGERFYLPKINAASNRNQGIFEQTNPSNPFSEYSTVVVPYCTGDIHLGDRDATYTLRDDKGESRQVTIYHRGQPNAMAVLRWVRENFSAPREIFVSGTSAGSKPSPFYASLLARHYPQARIVALADAGGHRGLSLPPADASHWGFPQVIRRHPGWERFPDNWEMSDFFITAARSAPRVQLLEVDHAYDANAYFRLRQLGKLKKGKAEILELLRADQREIARQVPSFRFFTIGGMAHGALPQSPFYFYTAGGRRFRDWVAAAAAGRPVSSVDCGDCSRADLIFSELDLRILERALALVSPPARWNSADPPQQCGPKLDTHSLECAIAQATYEITGNANLIRIAGAWEVIYTAMARMTADFDQIGDQQSEPGAAARGALRLFNNRPGTTAADVIRLLEETRDRIRADLSRKAK